MISFFAGTEYSWKTRNGKIGEIELQDVSKYQIFRIGR